MTPAALNSLRPRFVAAERSKNRSEHTLRALDLHLRSFCDFLTESDETEITPLSVVDWRASLYASEMKQSSIHQYMVTVRRFFTWAKKMGLIDMSPFPDGEIPKYEVEKQSIPTEDEILRLIREKPYTLVSKTPLRNYAIVAFMILTGLRSDELRELRLSDLDFDTGHIRVRHGKGDKERVVPFIKDAQEIIRDYLALGVRPAWCSDEDYLFGTGKETSDAPKSDEVWHKWDCATLGRMVKRYVMKMIGKDVHPHTLRHCAASLWVHAGASMRDVQLVLGHASITTTEKVYVDILNEGKAATDVSDIMNVALNKV